MMQTYQLQQEKKRLGGEVQRANCQSERLRQEVNVLRGRLEETEWGLCQKTGEISLLKSQLKDYQVSYENREQSEHPLMFGGFWWMRRIIESLLSFDADINYNK